jgi:hypothetical protein
MGKILNIYFFLISYWSVWLLCYLSSSSKWLPKYSIIQWYYVFLGRGNSQVIALPFLYFKIGYISSKSSQDFKKIFFQHSTTSLNDVPSRKGDTFETALYMYLWHSLFFLETLGFQCKFKVQISTMLDNQHLLQRLKKTKPLELM